MERVFTVDIEKLPEGLFLATSDDMPGLVAQGRTIAETLEIARDVARKLLEAQAGGGGELHLMCRLVLSEAKPNMDRCG